jgi:hypothetical protein
MNISSISSATDINQPPAPANVKPKQQGDHDGDADDGVGAVSSTSETTESGKLNATA